MNLEIIVYLLGNIFRIYISCSLFRIFFDGKVSKQRYIVRICLCIVYFLINSFSFLYLHTSPIMNVIINFIGITTLVYTYKGNWQYRLYAVLTVISLCVLCEDITYYFLVNTYTRYILIIGTIVTQLLLFTITLLLQKTINLKKGEEISVAEWASAVLIPFFSILISTVTFDNCNDEKAVLVGGICMIFINIMAFYLLERVQDMYRMRFITQLIKKQNRSYKNQILLWEEMEMKIQGVYHDMNNHIFALEQLAKKNQNYEIQKYLQNLSNEIEVSKKLVTTGNYIIDSFLNMKLGKAIECGTQVFTNIKISKNIPLNPEDISIVLGNILDNALQALEKCDNKKCSKMIKIIMKEEPGKLFLQIINSYDGEVKKSGNTYRTTKDKKRAHGFGLKNVQKVVEKYHGQMEIQNTRDKFSVKILIFI